LLERRLHELAGQCNPQDVANALWAFAKLRWTPRPATWGALAERLGAIALQLKAQELSIALWSIATLNLEVSPSLSTAMQSATLEGVWWFQAQSVANSLWALGRLASADVAPIEVRHDLVGALAEQAAIEKARFSPQGLANTFVGLVQLGASAEQVAPLAEAVWQDTLGSVDVGEIAWALGRVRSGGPGWPLLLRRAWTSPFGRSGAAALAAARAKARGLGGRRPRRRRPPPPPGVPRLPGEGALRSGRRAGCLRNGRGKQWRK